MLKRQHLIIAIPIYNDWGSLAILLREINQVAANRDLHLHVVIIDDGSTQSCSMIREEVQGLIHIERIIVLHLACNLGHQKAIALGLAYINKNFKFDQVIVMDSDGEDRPDDILRLLDEHRQSPNAIIFGRRTRRSEDRIFRFFYVLYKIGFRLLTGAEISFGNFALIPAQMLKRIVYLPEIWNHFAAGIIRSRLPWQALSTTRGRRYSGQSKMNFVSLIVHGMSAISVFIEILTVRLILGSLAIILLGVLGFIALLYIKYFTALAIPGWATSVAIGLVLIMFQAVILLSLLTFMVLNYRANKLFIPVKDYADYFFDVERLR